MGYTSASATLENSEEKAEDLLNVLIVDDQPSVQRLIKKMLHDIGYFKDIDVAADGEAAWESIAKKRVGQYDMVITDLFMPKLDGIGLITRCLKTPFARDIPFLAITGQTKPEIFAVLGEVGVRDCLVKPFSHKLLEDRVTILLQRLRDPVEKSFSEISNLIQDGSFEEAYSGLERLSAQESEKPRWLNLKGEILLGMGKLDDARECIEKALTSCDCYLTALCNQAKLEEKAGNIEKAIDSLEKADALSPLMVSRKITLGDLLFQVNREKDAEEILCKAASITQDCETKFQIAEKLSEKGFDKNADKIIKRLLTFRATNIETYNKIGIKLRKEKKYKDAEKAYFAALTYFPANAAIYYNLGVLSLYESKNEKACECFKKALGINPDFLDAQDMLDYYCSGKEEGEKTAKKPSPREWCYI